MKISNVTILSTDLINNTAKISFTISEATENVNVYLKINDEEYVEIFLNKTNEVLEYTVNVSRGVNNLFLKATDSTTEYISEPIQVLLKETPSIENLECSYSDSTGKYILNFAFNGDINFKYNIYLKLDANDYIEVLSSQISGDKTIEQTSTMGNHTCILKVSDGYDDYTFSPFQFEITNHKPILSKVLVTDITNSGEAYIYYSTKDIEPSTLTHKLIIGTTETVITPTKVDNFYSYRITGLSEGTSNCKISISDGIDTISSDVFSIEVFSDTTNKKELLRRAKVRYDSAYQQLRDVIVSVTSDLKYDYDIENALIAKAQDNYKIEYSNFNKISQQSIDAIGNNKVTVTKKELQSEIKDVDNAVNSLENTMWGVFQDGVLDQTERDTLSSSLDLVTKEKSDIDKGYQTLYNNEDLIDPSKTKLQTNYNNFIKAHNSLVTTINNIINKEGIINNTDKTNIDTAFENWRTALGNYRVASLEAIDSIAKKKADNSADVVDKKWAEIVLDPETGIKTQVGSLQTKITGADGIEERLETTNSKVSSIETNLNGITQRVSSTETTTATLTNKVNTVEGTANSAQSTANSANSSATNALNKANDANTLANSKAKVFTSTPTVPYQVGDLWVQGTNGDVMKCKTARTTGSYTASDWEKASKYTDDTKANAVDGKVTNLQTEYNKTKSQVAEIVTDLNGITQRVSSTESTTATIRADLQSVSNVANNANSKVDNLQIGATNLLKNTKDLKNWGQSGGNISIAEESYKGLTVQKQFGDWAYKYVSTNLSILEVGKEYTASVYLKCTGTSPTVYFTPSSNNGLNGNGTSAILVKITDRVTTDWKRYSVTFTVTNNYKLDGNINMRVESSGYTNGSALYVAGIKLEKGNKATDWTPAPEDIDSSIDAVDGKVTTLQGEYNTTKSKVATLETNLDGITQRVSSTESTTTTLTNRVNMVEGTANTAKSTADTANTNATNALNTANSTNTKLNNLQIGGRNLLRNSQNYSNWLGENGTTVSTIDNSNEPTKILQVTTNGGGGGHVKINVSNYIRGKEYILSFYAKNISGDKTIKFEPHGGPVYSVTSTSEWVQYKVKIIPNQNWSSTVPYFYFNNKNNTSVFQIKNVKLEEGNKATDWTPAPEDIDGAINSVDSKVNTLRTEYNSTKSKVATIETNLSGITSRVSSAETNIEKISNASSQNLLYNSDFRIVNGGIPDGWTVDDNSKITLDTSSTLLDGIPTFWFNVTGLTENAWKAVYSPFIDAKAGEKFVASAYVKGHNNWSVLDAGGGLEIEYFNDSTRLATSGANIDKSNLNWQRIVAKGIAPTDTTRVRIRVHPTRNGQFNMSKPMLQYGETVTGWDRGFDIKNLTTRLKTAEQKITDNAITNTVKKNFYTKSETDNQITSKGYQTASQVQQTVNGLEAKFTQSGGYNLLLNSNFERGLEHWTINGMASDKVKVQRNNNGCPVNPIEVLLEGTLGSGSGCVSQSFSWSSNEPLTLSWYQWTSNNGTDGSNVYRGIQVTITYTDGSNSWHTSGGQTELSVWQKRSMTITPTSGKRISWISVEMWARDTSKQIVYTSLMLEKGTIATNWTPNPNEMHDGIITLDKDGVKVEMQDGEGSQGYSLMSYDGFSIFDSNNNRTAWFGQDDTSYINTLYTNNVECNRLVKLQPGRPQQFYVNANPPSGSDGSGTSVSNACRSITEMFRKIKSTYGQYSNWQDITINVAEGSYYETVEILGFMGCGKIYVNINANAKLYGFWKIYDNTMKVVINGERTGGNNANNGAQFFLTDESITTLIHVRNSVCMVKNVRSINKCRPNSSGDKYGCSFIHVEAGRAMMINCDVSRYLYAMQATECSIGNVAGSRGYAYTSCFAKYGSHIITSGYPNEVKASWSSWGGHVEINGSKYASLYDSNYESSSSTTPSKPSTSATVFSQSFTLENLESIPEGSGSPTSKRSGVIGQGKWGRYKPHRGWGNIPSSLVDFCKNSTNISMTITMTRQNTNHGYAGAVPSPKFIYSEGTWDSGTTFARGATKTITLPSTIVNAIANGSMTSIQLYAGYSTNDYSFYQNITITVRLTKNI